MSGELRSVSGFACICIDLHLNDAIYLWIFRGLCVSFTATVYCSIMTVYTLIFHLRDSWADFVLYKTYRGPVYVSLGLRTLTKVTDEVNNLLTPLVTAINLELMIINDE